MKSLYCVCDECNAKWFCPRPPPCCPRCGSRDFYTTRARRPWDRAPRPSAVESKARSIRRHNTEPTSTRLGFTLPSVEHCGEGSA
jgi:hypothetical protein